MLQQVLASQERDRGGIYGNVGGDRATLRMPALGAMTHLDRCQRSKDGEADTSAEARSLLLVAHA